MAQRKNSGRTTPRAAFNENRNASATKRGPGRFHADGHQKASPPKHKGASHGFVLHKASAEKKERRALVKGLGRRKAVRAIKLMRAHFKAAASARVDMTDMADAV